MAQARWRAKPKGFATVKRGEWWVRPPGAAGTGAAQPNPARNRLPPREYVGSQGLIGSWRREPRLNPDQYEWTINPETGRWWARPRTELTGLSPQQRADIAQFDRTTEAQRQRIIDAYDRYAQQAAADRDAGAAALGKLANLSAAGFTDTVSGQAYGPYGPVHGASLSQAEQALPGVLAQGAREGQAARSAQTIAALNQLPTVARSEGLTAAERFLADRLGQRQEAIGEYRGQQAKAAEAAAEQAFRNRQLQATLRIAQGGQAVDLEGIRSRERVAAADRQAKLTSDIARLQTQLRIARENNRTKLATQLEKQIAKKREQRQKVQRETRVKVRNAEALARSMRLETQGGFPIPYTLEDYVDAIVGEFSIDPKVARRIARRVMRQVPQPRSTVSTFF